MAGGLHVFTTLLSVVLNHRPCHFFVQYFTVLPCSSFLSIQQSPCQDFTLTILRKYQSSSFCGFSLSFGPAGSHIGWGFISLVLHSIEYTFPMSLHPLALMFHQCIVAQSMQESLSYDSDMGQYLHLCSAYDDLQNLVTIMHLSHLLLHRICFAHINRPSGNHIFILQSFIYTLQFPTKVFTTFL